jgi:hypothetical protein
MCPLGEAPGGGFSWGLAVFRHSTGGGERNSLVLNPGSLLASRYDEDCGASEHGSLAALDRLSPDDLSSVHHRDRFLRNAESLLRRHYTYGKE